MAGISLPILLAASAAHSALKPPKGAATLSAAVPSAEDLESLGRFLSPAAMQGVPVIGNATGMRIDGPDPFASVYEAPIIDSAGVAGALPVRERNVVSAILISTDRRVAVIDETLVSVGSLLPGGFRVTGIEKDHVEIVTPGGVRRLISVREPNGL